MAKIVKFVGIVDAASGKVCQDSNVSFVFNKRTGKCHTLRRHPELNTYEPSAKQLAQQAAFGSNIKIAAAWVKAHKTVGPDGKVTYDAEYVAMKRLYNMQTAVNGFTAFLAKRIDPESGQIAPATEA